MTNNLPNTITPESSEILGRAVLHLEKKNSKFFGAEDLKTSFPFSAKSLRDALDALVHDGLATKSDSSNAYQLTPQGEEIGEKWLLHQNI